MTWLSFAAKSGSLLLVTPLVLRYFQPAEISLWFLFLIIAGLQLMADFGFSPSCIRAISYARAGRRRLDSLEDIADKPNEALLAGIFRVLTLIYRRLTAACLLGTALIGTWAVFKPISLLSSPEQGWIAWGIVLFCNGIVFRNNAYGAWMQGMNQVALLRRLEASRTLLATAVTAMAIYLSRSFLVGVAVSQVTTMLASFAIRSVASRFVTRKDIVPSAPLDREIFEFIWPAAWRSGVGVLMSNAVIQASGIIYAQFGSPEKVAPYLFAMRIMQMIVQTSMAPFYSKIPWFATLYGAGKKAELIPVARQAMSRCHWFFTIAVVGVAFAMNPLLHLIGSQMQFVPTALWMTMGVAYLIERIGAMHIQFYSLSNHILWHIANGISGTIYLVASTLLLSHIGVYAFPVGMILAYAGFYTWFSARLVYRHYKLNPLQFEFRSCVGPGTLLGVSFLLYSLVHN